MLIQIILIFFIILFIWRLALRFKNKEIDAKEFLIWLLFWISAGLVAAWPKATDDVANFLGVGTGFNLLVALSILIIFYLLFKLFVKLEKTQREITKIVEHLALNRDDKNKDNYNL